MRNLPSSVIAPGVHGGSHTQLTSTVSTPSNGISAARESSMIFSVSGQPIEVRVMSSTTLPASSALTL